MPLKDFECPACHHKFEELLQLSEPNPEKCPKCGAAGLKQVLGTFRIAGLGRKSARDEAGPDAGMPGGDAALDGGGFGEEGLDTGMDDGYEDYMDEEPEPGEDPLGGDAPAGEAEEAGGGEAGGDLPVEDSNTAKEEE